MLKMWIHFQILLILFPIFLASQIFPHSSFFPSPVAKILYAGTNQNKDCNPLCKDLCLRNSLGENCLHTCGCVLGRNIIFLLLANGQLFRSTDMGKIWDDEAEEMNEGFIRYTKLKKHLNDLKKNEDFLLLKDIIPSPENPNIFWLIGKNAMNWRTEDAGESYIPWYIEFLDKIYPASSLLLHPIRNSSVLATVLLPEGCENWSPDGNGVGCKQGLLVSHDIGHEWELIDGDVKRFEWGNAGKLLNKIETRYHQHYVFGNRKRNREEDVQLVNWTTVYFSKNKEKKGEVMVVCFSVRVYGEIKCTELLENLHSFHFFRNFIYLAFYLQKEVKILVSHNLDKYMAITFGDNSSPAISSFNFFEDKHGLMFLYLNEKDSDYGTLYRSDYTGQRFTKLLPNVHRSPHKILDFLEVTSLDGVFLANIVQLKPVGNDFQQKIQTVISYDNGNKWHYLMSPKEDHIGKPIVCGYKDQCHLHLALNFHHRQSPSIVIKPKSIGVILALGNLGTHLNEDLDSLKPFLSIDGGVTWKLLDSTPNFLSFGDLGSLIFLGSNQELSFKYSWDTWHNTTEFSVKNLHNQAAITEIVSHPLSNAQEFLVIGETDKGGISEGFVILMDFSEVNERQCKEPDDYETFIPKAYEQDCILGRKVSYLRKRPDSQCYNGQDFEAIEKQENCECSASDYECDWGFYKSTSGGCEPISQRLVQTNFTIECYNLHRKHYLFSVGYRKILGDSCEGKTVFEPIELECPIYFLGLSRSQLIWILIVIVSVFICVTAYEKRLLLKMNILSLWGDLTYQRKLNQDDIVFNDNSYNEEESNDLMDTSKGSPL